MRICSNCGTTNAEDKEKFCRTCGALLPVKRPPRIRVESNDLERNKHKVKTATNIANKSKPATNNGISPSLNVESQFFT